MKRFLTTIVCVLCVLAAYAVSYGTSYKGSGYSGRIYTTSSVHATSVGSGGIIASAPMATMGSTSSYKLSQMSSISTSGGVIGGTYPRITTLLTSGGHGGQCPNCVDKMTDNHDGTMSPGPDGFCDICGDDLMECECDPCRCPIGDGCQVWLFMAGMAMVYTAYKKRTSHRTVTSTMRTTCERE